MPVRAVSRAQAGPNDQVETVRAVGATQKPPSLCRTMTILSEQLTPGQDRFHCGRAARFSVPVS